MSQVFRPSLVQKRTELNVYKTKGYENKACNTIKSSYKEAVGFLNYIHEKYTLLGRKGNDIITEVKIQSLKFCEIVKNIGTEREIMGN
jgi:hypothetical protein